MKVYELFYIQESNGESGACRSYHIMKTTDKEKIEKFISQHNIKTKSMVSRGEEKVFVYRSYELKVDEYLNPDMLKYALEDLNNSRKVSR